MNFLCSQSSLTLLVGFCFLVVSLQDLSPSNGDNELFDKWANAKDGFVEAVTLAREGKHRRQFGKHSEDYYDDYAYPKHDRAGYYDRSDYYEDSYYPSTHYGHGKDNIIVSSDIHYLGYLVV